MADMIGRGKSRNVDEYTNDIIGYADDKFYSKPEGDMLVFPAGKLGQDKYKGSITQILFSMYSITRGDGVSVRQGRGQVHTKDKTA